MYFIVYVSVEYFLLECISLYMFYERLSLREMCVYRRCLVSKIVFNRTFSWVKVVRKYTTAPFNETVTRQNTC